MGKSLFKNKMILLIVALIFALIGTSLFVGNRQIKIANEITVAEDLTGPTESTEGYWTDEGRRGDSFAGGDGLTEETAYEIATAEQLAYLAYSVNNGNSYSGKYFKQTADIDLSKYYWKPIGSVIYYFQGNYNGGNYTISGVFTPPFPSSFIVDYFSDPNAEKPDLQIYDSQGLFGYFFGVLKNINVTSSKICGRSAVGGIAGAGSLIATINNCHFSGEVVGNNSVGGIAGDYVGGIYNCSNSGNIYGRNYTIYTITSTEDEDGNLIPEQYEDIYNSQDVGGISGTGRTIKYSCNFGKVTGYENVGGITGAGQAIYNCYNIGEINGNINLGGIVGEGGTAVTNCYNSGFISDGVRVGGIIGAGGQTLIINCFNVGKFDNIESAGALMGYVGDAGVTILNSYYYDEGGTLSSIYENNSTNYIDNSKIIENLFEIYTLQWYTDKANWFEMGIWDFDFIWQINEKEGEYEYMPIKFQGESNIIYWTDEEIIGNHQGFEEEGTEEDPYLIEDEYDLAYLSYTVLNSEEPYNYVNKYFKQTKDLNMSQYAWTPIGQIKGSLTIYEGLQSFSGNYNGNFYTISGLNTFIDLIDYDEFYSYYVDVLGNGHAVYYQGLFGFVCTEEDNNNYYTSQIKNLGIVNSNIEGYCGVGGIAGYCRNNVFISNCYNTAYISGSSTVGGITGGGAMIINCYNSGELNYKPFDGSCQYGGFGGIAGGFFGDKYGDQRDIINCYNEGKINLNTFEFPETYPIPMTGGGIVGISYSSIINCFNVGEINGNIIAGIGAWVEGSLYGNYSLGQLNAEEGADALFYKNNINTNYIGLNFYAASVGEGITSQYGQLKDDLTFENFKNEEFFTENSNWYIYEDWDFETTWEFREGENDGFPVLMVYRPTYWRDYRAESFSGGDGKTPETAFEISSAEELALLAYEVNYGSTQGITQGMLGFMFFENIYFKQTCDIDLSEHIWEPIGRNYQSMHSFAGNYDGQGYAIIGVYTERHNYASGLFGLCCNDTTRSYIKNIVLSNSKINATSIASGICAYFANYEISNCFNYAKVNSYGMAAGGVAGGGMYSDVINCLNFGEVNAYSSSGMAGGVAAFIMEGNILNCGNEGIINGTIKASICVQAMQCDIENCYSISNGTIKMTGMPIDTISNCLYINSDGKFYVGATDTEGNNITSLAEFAWINENSCPIPKSLTWLGQYFTQDITELITKDPEWKNVAA